MSNHLKPAMFPITEDDAFIESMLDDASIPTLMMSLVHITGDVSLLRGAIRLRTPHMGETQGGLSEEEKDSVRKMALRVLADFRDKGCRLPPPPDEETVREMMNFLVGTQVPADYTPFVLEELALDGEDARIPAWTKEVPESVKRKFHVVVIGGGMSGLLSAMRLKEAGIPFTAFEKNDSVGGTWYENRYPGCRVDIPNHFYSYSFYPNHDWEEYFSRQPDLAAYFRRFADEHGLGEYIRYKTEVVSARFEESSGAWTVSVKDETGKEYDVSANAVISAVGQLNRPMTPSIPGQDRFQGPQIHTGAWQSQHDLHGKRIAVVGTGASAFQVVPELAKIAGELFVFQRSPVWMFPNPDYHATVSDSKKWMLKHVPYYARWYRFLMFWPGSGVALNNWRFDPTWPHPERAVSAANDDERIKLTEWIKNQIGDDEALLKKVIPTYPVGGKRMLQDNGSWLRALKQSNVELVTDSPREFDETGIFGHNGHHYPVDAIVYATGFHANKFLWPMEITGREGVKLSDFWGDEPRAYLGITVPGFPNLFCLYGPGTNLAHAGSIIFHSECQVRYALAGIKAMIENGHREMDVKPAVFQEFNQRLIAELDQLVWSHPSVNNWYKNSKGRVVNTSPWSLADYWKWTRKPDPEDYEWR
ncbi:4-hydroxyacetophenone monooxygenase [Paraburkholderia sp. BL18I3N2]|uniref:flavin-containing monooxygenase n=1 Tax=Paraburkholderia sp. BL18I3N2 TaxID=1938799 RepID=UPI000D47C56B|nr:NAD(P)/FAD-dependent oxidoreductase [Paraburkholderia sp. BL18I3N2]PRX27381.1 4-hydroxyacetophenone monooxygenase [Paraburkholderia sp. BL18I3N2]